MREQGIKSRRLERKRNREREKEREEGKKRRAINLTFKDIV